MDAIIGKRLPLFVNKSRLAAHLGIPPRDVDWLVADHQFPKARRLWWHGDVEKWLAKQEAPKTQTMESKLAA